MFNLQAHGGHLTAQRVVTTETRVAYTPGDTCVVRLPLRPTSRCAQRLTPPTRPSAARYKDIGAQMVAAAEARAREVGGAGGARAPATPPRRARRAHAF